MPANLSDYALLSFIALSHKKKKMSHIPSSLERGGGGGGGVGLLNKVKPPTSAVTPIEPFHPGKFLKDTENCFSHGETWLQYAQFSGQ